MTDVKYSQAFYSEHGFLPRRSRSEPRLEGSAGPLVLRDNRKREKRLDGRFEAPSPAALEN